MASSTSLFSLPEAVDESAAWLFPGQGAQEVGMGKDLCEASAAARQVFATADATLGYSLSSICFEGPEEKLRDTAFSQPAIFTASVAALAAALEAGIADRRPTFMAGHSLGEYSALVAAGAMSLEQGLRLVQERGRLMAEASEVVPGTLAAILGLDEQVVVEVCKETDVDVCNLNLPTQTVIGGEVEKVQAAIALAKERGAQRAMQLNVSGAFHSRLMRPAAEQMGTALATAEIGLPDPPVVANVSARLLDSVDAIRDELQQQVASPVRWHESVTLMAAAGVTRFVEFGPGKVLTGMIRRLAPGAQLVNIGRLEDLAGG